ncbi:serine/threonine-protein kinase [Streptomyces sp. NPDC000349]|uniref:serine/threonine-protein kinase n=1 Tax=unclassified Streptomyces TaxID=2593676 RepID=UPI00277DCCEA|nr:serine/threonine-protein kinase [Streptomyces sp. DSM 40167]MDQ0401856.1 serine/threonine-protein kinase [Streptomyces sp. DSM 40167]
MQGQLLGGRYRTVRQLGAGGMGEVWEARDETLDRLVAVKVISLLAGGGSRGDETRARFLREARITARLQHPNIVTTHDLGETTGSDRVPFLVMELLRGEGLDAKLGRGPVGLSQAARWGAQVAEALSSAHEADVMHRDIKPSNVLVSVSGVVKVLDFGVARAADVSTTSDRITQTGFIVGSPPYMAPEQARGFPEPRSDLYALGCLLFELITGRLPFQAPDTVGYLAAHLTQPPPVPSAVRPVPAAWDELVTTLLSKEPADRYPDASALSRALLRLDEVGPTPGGPAHDTTRTATVPGPQPRPAPTVPAAPAPSADRAAGRDRDRLARFGPPVALCLLFVSTFDYWNAAELYSLAFVGFLGLLAVLWGLTAALTPASGKPLRVAGYAIAALLCAGVLVDTVMIGVEGEQTSVFANMQTYAKTVIYGGTALSVAAYDYRDISIRRTRRRTRESATRT